MLKKYLPNLHPRIETLLLHHRRPLGISSLYSNNIDYYCLAFDPYLYTIISLFNRPIGCLYCSIGSSPVGNFRNVREQYVNTVDYVSIHKQGEQLSGIIPNKATYDEEGLLIFKENRL